MHQQPTRPTAPPSPEPRGAAGGTKTVGGSGRAWKLPAPLRVLVNGLQLLAIAIWSAFWITAALLVRWLRRSSLPALRMAHTCWAPGILRLTGQRVEAAGLDRFDASQPHFFTANHQSMADIAAIYAVLPVPLVFVLKEELYRVPFLGWYAEAMGMIFVRRGDRAQSLRSLRGARKQVEDGKSILTFPEGTRSQDGQLRRFKSGALMPAIEMAIPVVPIALTGTGYCLPAGSARIRPTTIRVLVGKPIPTRNLQVGDRRDLANQAHAATADLLRELESEHAP